MIVIDTNIFIYHLTAHPQFGPAAKELLLAVEAGRVEAVASLITYAEILTLPARARDMDLVERYRELLLHYPHLKFLPVDEACTHEAALLRAHSPALKMMDAMILATVRVAAAKVLVTEDKRLKVRNLPFAVAGLKEYLERPSNFA